MGTTVLVAMTVPVVRAAAVVRNKFLRENTIFVVLLWLLALLIGFQSNGICNSRDCTRGLLLLFLLLLLLLLVLLRWVDVSWYASFPHIKSAEATRRTWSDQNFIVVARKVDVQNGLEDVCYRERRLEHRQETPESWIALSGIRTDADADVSGRLDL
jgi:hypothetical protein